MSERVTSAEVQEMLANPGIHDCDWCDVCRDLLDARARVDALMFNEEISQDVLEQSEARVKELEEEVERLRRQLQDALSSLD